MTQNQPEAVDHPKKLEFSHSVPFSTFYPFKAHDMSKVRKPVEVKVLREGSVDELVKATNKYIMAGWEPLGGIVVVPDQNLSQLYAMTMVNYEMVKV